MTRDYPPIKQARKMVKDRLKAVSCKTENDEDYERVISWNHYGYLMGSDLEWIREHTGLHINNIYVKPTGVSEILWVRERR